MAGAALQSNATENAADTAASESRAARDTARADLAPFTAAGVNALAPAQSLLGLNGQDAASAAMANFQQSPGYQYQLDQGVRAVQNSAAAQGMLHSGATLKAIQDRGTQLANADFGTYYNRLMGLVQSGQSSAAGQASGSLQTGANLAQTAASAGAAQASIYGNTAQGIGNQLNNYANYSMYQDRTNALAGGGSRSFSGTTGVSGNQSYYQNAPVQGFG